jgi:hypothetical protein
VGKEQSKAVKGKGGDALRVAMDKEREALRRVLDAMTERAPQLSSKEAELRGTLLAASRGSEEVREKLRRGILSTKVEPAGFGPFMDIPQPAADAGDAPAKKGAEAKERAAQREAELKKKREVKKLEAEKKRLATQLARAESKAVQAENDAALLREKADALKQEMEALEERLR